MRGRRWSGSGGLGRRRESACLPCLGRGGRNFLGAGRVAGPVLVGLIPLLGAPVLLSPKDWSILV